MATHFITYNIQPQWTVINVGVWNDMEQNIRQFATKKMKQDALEILTGTHGICELRYKEKIKKKKVDKLVPFYLVDPDPAKKELPVPK